MQIIAIDAPEDVLQLMYRLYPCGIEVPLWSPPQPIPETEESCESTSRTLDKTTDNSVEKLLRPRYRELPTRL